ncbi:hypothetical protein SAMN03159362_2452 [Pseudomonas sp. NFIX51]|nr:hypothetical protein SAMN03159362_2452 [Pseudomonas sp. NFIX51]
MPYSFSNSSVFAYSFLPVLKERTIQEVHVALLACQGTF